MDRILINLKKKLVPVVILTLSCGYIHVYTVIVQQANCNISQISGEHLQDHWSPLVYVTKSTTPIKYFSNHNLATKKAYHVIQLNLYSIKV